MDGAMDPDLDKDKERLGTMTERTGGVRSGSEEETPRTTAAAGSTSGVQQASAVPRSSADDSARSPPVSSSFSAMPTPTPARDPAPAPPSRPPPSPAFLGAHARSKSYVAGSAHASPMVSATHPPQGGMYSAGGAGSPISPSSGSAHGHSQDRGQAHARSHAARMEQLVEGQASARTRTPSPSLRTPASPRGLALFHAEDAVSGGRVERASPPAPPPDFNTRPSFSEAGLEAVGVRSPATASAGVLGSPATAARQPGGRRSRPGSAEDALAGSPRAFGEGAVRSGTGSSSSSPVNLRESVRDASLERTRSRSASATGRYREAPAPVDLGRDSPERGYRADSPVDRAARSSPGAGESTRPDLFRRTSGRDRRRQGDAQGSPRSQQADVQSVQERTSTPTSSSISELRLGSRPSTAQGSTEPGAEGLGISVDPHTTSTEGRVTPDEDVRARSAPASRAGSGSAASATSAHHRNSGSSRADSRRSSQRDEHDSPSLHLDLAREEFLTSMARRASSGSGPGGAEGTAIAGDDRPSVTSPVAEGSSGSPGGEASRQIFQATFNRVYTGSVGAPITPPQVAVDHAHAGVVSPSTLLDIGVTHQSMPKLAVSEGLSPEADATHAASSALSSGDEASSPPTGLARSSSLSRANASGSMLGRWAAARDRRASPPMLAALSSATRSPGAPAADANASAETPIARSGDTARLWDSVWPTSATSSPRRSPLTRSNSHTAARLHHPDPPPLQHHAHTYPPEASDSMLSGVTASGESASDLQAGRSPAAITALHTRSGSASGPQSMRSPTLGARDPSNPNSPARSSFSSPESWAARPRSSQHHGRPQSPPGAPVALESERPHASVLAARRSTGGIHTRSPAQESKGSPASSSSAVQSPTQGPGGQTDTASDVSPKTVPGAEGGERSNRASADDAEIPKVPSPPVPLPPAQAEAPITPPPSAGEPAGQDAAENLQLDLEPPSPASVSEPHDFSPSSVSAEGPSPSVEMPHEESDDRGEVHGTGERMEVAEFDEIMAAPKEMLPNDVAFEDEGLNTLERIFLLSKSEFPFHRGYIARALADLLDDVDPCETVEYVLPLLSGLATDPDETVKEAFAGEIHRIVWFFFSSCSIMTEEDGLIVDTPPRAHSPPAPPSTEVTVITSEGIKTIPRPSVSTHPSTSSSQASAGSTDSVPMSVASRSSAAYDTPTRKSSVATTASTSTGTASSGTPGSASMVDTPDSTVSSQSNNEGSPKTAALEQVEEVDEDHGELKERPVIAVNVFTQMLGAMLLSQNAAVAEPTRAAVVALVAKLRGNEQAIAESVQDTRRVGQSRKYVSQTGLHIHDVYAFSDRAKKAVEKELVEGLVLGMGNLDAPPSEADYQESNAVDDVYQLEGMTVEDAVAFRTQLREEATFGRAVSMNLISSVAEYYPTEDAERLGFLQAIAGTVDDDVAVKTEAALALAYIAKTAPSDQVLSLIPLFERFSHDESDQVQQSACLCLPAVCKRINPPERRRQVAVELFREFMKCKTNVQYTVLEVLGEVIHLFNSDPFGPPPELLEYYLSTKQLIDGQDAILGPEEVASSNDDETDPASEYPVVYDDLDRAMVAAYNFPGVCLTLGPGRWSEIRETYLALQRINHHRVRLCLASSLHELALILGPDIATADLLPFFYQYLEGSPEIRQKATANVHVIVANVHGNGRGKEEKDAVELVEVLSKLWADGYFTNWREREHLATQIGRLLEVFVSSEADDLDFRSGGRHVDEAVVEDAANGTLELLRSGLVDPFTAVRVATVQTIPHCFETVKGVEHLRNRLLLLLQELSGHESFKIRITYIACVEALLDSPYSTASSPSLVLDRNADRRAFFEEYFLEPLSIMCDDLVDVKLALSKLLGKICAKNGLYAKTVLRPLRLVRMLDVLRNDESHYVTKPLEDVSNTPPGFDRQSSLRSSAWNSDDASLLDEVYTIVRNENGKSSHRMRKARSEAAGMGMTRTDSDTTIRPVSTPSEAGALSPGPRTKNEDRQARSAPAYIASSVEGSRMSSSKLSISTGRPDAGDQDKSGPEPNQVGMTDVFEQSFQEALAEHGGA